MGAGVGSRVAPLELDAMSWLAYLLAAAGLFLVGITIGPLVMGSRDDDAHGRDFKSSLDDSEETL